jgi:hypothetical protein
VAGISQTRTRKDGRGAKIPKKSAGPALALASSFRYKPALISDFARAFRAGRLSPGADRNHLPRTKDFSYGRSEKKNIAVAAWHASFG